jgi:hypothetical protein
MSLDDAATAAALAHGAAAASLPGRAGLVASDLLERIPVVLDEWSAR